MDNEKHILCYAEKNFTPELMTESEVIKFLRIPEVSKAKDFHNAIEHLKRMRDLPCIHICNKPLYPREFVLEWIKHETEKER